jgi:hypothetical protein
MRRILLLILFGTAITGYAQPGTSVLPDSINNVKSPRHTNVVGTKLFVILPDSFNVMTKGFPTIYRDGNEFVQVTEFEATDFYKNTANLSKQTAMVDFGDFKSLEYKELTVNGYPAKFVLRADSSTLMYNLVFGDSTFVVTMAGFSSHDDLQIQQVEEIFKSVYYDKSEKTDPFAIAPFKLDDSKSIFKFARTAGLGYIYSIGGVNKPSYEGEPCFMVMIMPIDGMDKKLFTDGLFGTLAEHTTTVISEKDVNGLRSRQSEIHGTINGKDHYMFEHIVWIDDIPVIMEGIAPADFDKYLPEFEKLSTTIRKK